MIETLIALASGANTLFDLYGNISAIVSTNSSSDLSLEAMHEKLTNLEFQIERLSENILYVPELEGVRNLEGGPQASVENLRNVRNYLEPVQRALGGDIISSRMLHTPGRLLQTMKQNPWEVLDNIRPVQYASPPNNPALVPILF